MTDTATTLDRAKAGAAFDLAASLRKVATATGKTPMAQVSDIAKLTFGSGKLSAEEYYSFKLYDDAKYDLAHKRRFLGKKAQDKILTQCNPLAWWASASDKLVLYGLVAGLTYAVPQTQAIYHPFRRFGQVATLRDPDDVTQFLRGPARYPLFGKPVGGIHSVGVSALARYDAARDMLATSQGTEVGVEAYVQELGDFFKDGYLFQDRLAVHPEIVALCGDRIATVRMILLMTDDGPVITHALWKIPAGDNIADNFWRKGNLLASLSIETGEVLRVVSGEGVEQQEVECHPDTGEKLLGAVLPAWDLVTDHCLACASALPGLRMQAWDIAIGPQGPVMVEVNIGGDFNLPQIATGRGLLEGQFAEFVGSRVKEYAAARN